MEAVGQNEARIRNIGFAGADMSGNSFAWQMSSILLFHAILEKFQEKMRITYPTDNGLSVNVPVYTERQFAAVMELLSDATDAIAQEAEVVIDIVTHILKNHIPGHLKKSAKDMAYFRMFDDTIVSSVADLFERKYLFPYRGGSVLPTTYVVLKSSGEHGGT